MDRSCRPSSLVFWLTNVLLLTGVASVPASDLEAVQVTYLAAGQQQSVTAQVERQYGDGSVLLLAADGRMLTLHSQEIVEQKATGQPLQPMNPAQVIDLLKPELGSEFKYHQTKNYVIAYNTSDIYAQWIGQLFERLYRGFNNYWNTRRVPLTKPRFPLVAVVFSDKQSYLLHAKRDIGDSAGSMIGYYNMNTNRMFMYDLTGVDGLVPASQKVSSQAVINQILSRPEAERTVATIVHEAVHQLAFNSGLQVRLADNPLWLSEGLAMFFEAPDLQSPQGWKIGNVNYHNFNLLAVYLPKRPGDSLLTLIRDDARFKDAQTVRQAYPESWALTYFLMKARGKQFAAYLHDVSQLRPLAEEPQEKRLQMFEKHFGDPAELDRAFMTFLRNIR